MDHFANPEKRDAIQTVVDHLVDVSEGYETLLNRADEQVRTQIKPVAELHASHLSELRETMRRQTGDLDMTGTIMGTVHQTAVTLRDAFGDLDANAIDAVRRGEERVVAAYDSAIDAVPLESDLRSVLTKQRNAVSDQIDRLATAA